jgi:hypothetical protein
MPSPSTMIAGRHPGARSIRFLATPDADRSGGDSDDATLVVLDTAWTPGAADAPGLIPLRELVGSVIERRDLFAEALTIVDDWADRADARALLEHDGITYWYRLRESLWHWVHERLLWSYVLDDLELAPDAQASVPVGEVALIDVLKARGVATEVIVPPPPPPPKPRRRTRLFEALPRPLRRVLRGLRAVARGGARRRVDPAERMQRLLAARLGTIRSLPPRRALVISMPGIYQTIGDTTTAGRDPNLASVVAGLEREGVEPIVIGWGMPRGAALERSQTESSGRLLPSYFVVDAWGRPEDVVAGAALVTRTFERLDGLAAPLAVGRTDVTEPLVRDVRAWCDHWLRSEVGELARAERVLADLRPQAIVMSHEGHRIPWLVAAARAGIPTFAVQHGILYPRHPGYADRRDPGVVRPTRTFVYGPFERAVLEGWGYRADEVEVAGSPRLELDEPPPDQHGRDVDRAAVRREIGVADQDRLLVVSTTHLGYLRRYYVVDMIARVLGGPLPGVHVVFKQHPGERDDGPYRHLIDGMASAAGYASPPVSVVRDIDLMRLLRAADLHLGQLSTVLTDAVVAGAANAIAEVAATPAILDYVGAGVAVPVRDPSDLRAVLADPQPPDEERREAFLAEHFRPGPAGRRIAQAVRQQLAQVGS